MQQSLRHETVTGNLTRGRHAYFTTSNIASSFIKETVVLYPEEQQLYSRPDQWDATDWLHNKLINVGYENVCTGVILDRIKMQSVYICAGSLFKQLAY